jgi:DNA-binding NtrC family response regulator
MTLNFCNATPPVSVLIIDDDLSILNMLKLTLTRKGLNVDTAQSGEEGIKKIDSNEYRLILTDMQMPGLSGNQVLDYIKDCKKSEIPVIGMSGTPWLLNQEKFDAILSKPSSIENICTVVDKAVQKNA